MAKDRLLAPWQAGLALLIAATLAAPAALAQSDGMAAIRRAQLYHLQTRALGGEDVSQDARQLQRQLRLDSPRGTLGGQQRSIDREAARLQAPAFRPPPPGTGPGIGGNTGANVDNGRPGADLLGRAPASLPSSGPSTTRGLPEDPAPHLGGDDPVTTASRLMSRAENAIQSGRPDQARSDLAMAGRFLGELPPAADRSIAAGRVKFARDRLSSLQGRLPPR